MLNEKQVKELPVGYYPNRAWAAKFSLIPNWDNTQPYVNRSQRNTSREPDKRNKFGALTMSYSEERFDFVPNRRREQVIGICQFLVHGEWIEKLTDLQEQIIEDRRIRLKVLKHAA